MTAVIEENRWNSWTYNVEDRFKGKSKKEICETLRSTSHNFAVMMEHWQGDFNIGTMIRNANAFNAKKVFYYGKKKYDRRGTVGTHHYVDLVHINDPGELVSLKSRFTFVCLDNVEGSVPMGSFDWPENALMIFGEEGLGLTKEILELADYVVSIKQYGSVRSMNVGTTSGIAMYDYTSKLNE
jgi:tRNA G18 (ribose-2'-O)-methylase SpoU|tara:strand:- start:697 stop:1245 length:549 start_codon:yes stop_codon:yes gene_type:complete